MTECEKNENEWFQGAGGMEWDGEPVNRISGAEGEYHNVTTHQDGMEFFQ